MFTYPLQKKAGCTATTPLDHKSAVVVALRIPSNIQGCLAVMEGDLLDKLEHTVAPFRSPPDNFIVDYDLDNDSLSLVPWLCMRVRQCLLRGPGSSLGSLAYFLHPGTIARLQTRKRTSTPSSFAVVLYRVWKHWFVLDEQGAYPAEIEDFSKALQIEISNLRSADSEADSLAVGVDSSVFLMSSSVS